MYGRYSKMKCQTLFGKITQLLGPEIRRVLVRALFGGLGTRIQRSTRGHDLLAIAICNLDTNPL